MPPRINIRLSYDIVSPWSFIAFEVVTRYAEPWNIALDLHPAFLGGVWNFAGNKTPLDVRNKGPYMNADLKRVAGEYDVPVSFPRDFPQNSIHVMRLLRVLKDKHTPADLEKATRLLYHEFWKNHTPLTAPDVFYTPLIETGILTPSSLTSLLEESKSEANKQRLKDEAQRLVDEGAFGLPWFVVEKANGEKACFFGSDRFSSMAWWLGDGYSWDGPYPAKRKLSRL